MAKFIQLIKFTQEGVEQFEGIPDRLEEAREFAEEQGGEIVDYYVALGQYDAVMVVDMPDAEDAVVGTINALKAGTTEAETLRVFDEEDIKEIIDALPEEN